MVTTWTWLTEPLPLDAANTRRWADDSQTEFLNTPAELEAWLEVARPRLPRHRLDLPESFDQRDLNAFRELRDLLIEIFSALSEGSTAPAAALRRLAHTCLSHPVIQVLDEAGPAWDARDDQRPQDRFLGLIAANTVALMSTAADRIALCRAPGCHWLYLQGRPNQRWCHPDCGNRARVNRHKRLHPVVRTYIEPTRRSDHVD